MSLSIKQVNYFIATADFGQVSLAARELNVSQSAVTAAIRQVETLLGLKLFQRVPNGVRLTAEGARFLHHARNIAAAVNEAVQAPLTEDHSVGGTVTVGVSYTVAGYFLPRHHLRFSRAYPEIDINLVEMPRDEIESCLISRDIDIAVMLVSNLGNRKTIAFETLFRSRRRLWLPPEHRLLSYETVSLAEIAQEPYIMLTIDEADQTAGKYWERQCLEPNIVFHTSSVEAVRSMVAAGMGVSILSDMVYRPWSQEGQRLETRTVNADIPTMDVGLAWVKSNPPTGATRTFLDFLSHAFSSAQH